MIENTGITPTNNPLVWYAIYESIKESTPEILDQFIERSADRMGLSVDHFNAEFCMSGLVRRETCDYSES